MKTKARGAWVTVAVIVFFGIATVPAIAHHSFAMYDTSPQAEKTVTGKLIRFVIGANHSAFILEALNNDGSAIMDKGKPLTWNIETTSAAQLVGRNITVETFKYGTIFSVTFSPLRDGRNGGAQQRVPGVIMCGMKMPEGGCNEKTGKRY